MTRALGAVVPGANHSGRVQKVLEVVSVAFFKVGHSQLGLEEEENTFSYIEVFQNFCDIFLVKVKISLTDLMVRLK